MAHGCPLFRQGLFRLILVGGLLFSPLPASPSGSPASLALPLERALALVECFVDSAGANDESNQKDLTRGCINDAGLPSTIAVEWQWDDTGTGGSNTMNACAMFDTDGDGLANRAVCVNTNNTPATMTSFRVYTCTNSSADRCSGRALVYSGPPASANGTVCSVSQATNSNPFTANNTDTRANCTIDLDDVGGGAAELSDVCSFPSDNPNSDPSDCVITRESSGRLEVVKVVNPTSDSGQFNLLIDNVAYATGGHGASTGEKVVGTGSHLIGETAAAGTALANYSKSITCRNLNGTGAIIAGPQSTTSLNVSIADRSDVLCTITNTKFAKIIVQKQTTPEADPTQFSFVLTGPGGVNSAFALADNGSRDSGFVFAPGAGYSVAETLPSGWQQNSIVCTSSLGGSEVVNNISLSAGEIVTCVFNNAKIPNGSVTINKIATGGDAAFAFSGPAPFGAFSLSTANGYQQSFAEVTPGSYTIAETGLPGWDLTNIVCNDPTGNSAINIGAGSATVNIAPGESVNCTFTNVKRGSITIDKVTLPADDSQSFNFTTTGSGYSGFALTDTAAPNTQSVAPGIYGVSEGAVAGWDLTSAVCSDGSPISEIVVGAGEAVNCTVTNTRRSTLTLKKDIVPVPGYAVDDLFNLQIDGVDVGGPFGDDGSTGAQSYAGNSVHPIAETSAGPGALSDYTTAINCVGGTFDANSGQVTLPPGADVVCTFVNTRKRGVIELQKAFVPANDPGQVNLEIVGVTVAANQAHGGTTGDHIVPTGAYVVRETAGTATALTDYDTAISCSNSAGVVVASANNATTLTVPVAENANLLCTITNARKTGAIKFVKVVQGDLDATVADPASWQFDVNTGGPQDVPHNSTIAVNTGTYSVSESSGVAQNNADYALTDASGVCTLAGGIVTLVVSEAGGTCTVVNTRKTGTLEVRKNLIPAVDTGRFNLLIDGVTLATGGDGTTSGDRSVETGAHSIAESPVAGTNPTDYEATVSCIDQANGGAAVAVNGNLVDVGEGGDVLCVFTNRRTTTTLILEKKASDSAAVPGRDVTFVITVRNTGVINASNVIVSDPTPAGLTLLSVSPSQGVCNTFPCDLGVIAPGGSATIAATYHVPAGYAGADPVVNTATATSTEVPSIDPASDNIPVQRISDLGVIKSDGVPTYTPGLGTTYLITVTNSGPSDAIGVTFADLKPAQISSWTWTCVAQNGGANGCTGAAAGSADFSDVFNLPAGAELAYQVVATTAPNASGDLVNTASVRPGQGTTDPNESNDDSTDTDIAAPVADLSITKDDGVTSYTPGLAVTYTIVVANAGPSAVLGAQVQDAIPPQVTSWTWTCQSATGGATGCDALIDASTGFADQIDLPAGSSLTYRVVAQIASGAVGDMTNTANVDAPRGVTDPNTTNNSDDDIDTAVPVSNIRIDKTDNGAVGIPDGLIVYNITVFNDGPSDAATINLTETVPAHTTFDLIGSSAWSCVDGAPAGTVCTLTVSALAAGDSTTRQFAVRVVAGVPAGVSGTNNTVQASVPGGTPVSDSEPTPITANASLLIEKSDGRTNIQPGNTLAYVISVRNTGNQDAAGVTLEDTLPANTTFVAASDGGSLSSGKVAWTIGSLPAGGALTRVVTVTLNTPLSPSVTQIVNSAVVRDDGQNGDDPADNSATDTDIVVSAPDVRLTKTDGGAAFIPGATLVYTLTAINSGDQNVLDVIITETVPVHTQFVAGASSAGWSCVPNANAGAQCVIHLGPLNGGGAQIAAQFALQLVNPVPAGVESVTNVALGGGPGITPTVRVTETTPVQAAPVLVLTKTDNDASAQPGDAILYVLTVTNTGNQDAANVFIQEIEVPLHTTFVPASSSPGWVCTPSNTPGSTCRISVGGLPGNGGSASVNFVVRVDAIVPAGVTQIANAAVAGGTNAPVTPPATDSTPLLAVPDLAVTKTDGLATVKPGETLVYVITVRNNGKQGATGVTLRDTIPANTTFQSASNAGQFAAGVVSWTIGDLPAGAEAQRTVTVRVNTPLPAGTLTIENSAIAADDGSNGEDPNPGDNTGIDIDTVNGSIALVLTKSDGGAVVQPGGQVVYALTLRNTGDIGAPNSVITETVPQHTTFVPAASSAGWVCAPNNNAGSVCVFNVGTLAGGGGAVTVNFAVRADALLPSTLIELVNLAVGGTPGRPGPDETTLPPVVSPIARDTTPVQQVNLRAVKESDPPSGTPIEIGRAITYVIRLTNSGNLTATDVVISDAVPAGTALVAGSAAPVPSGLSPLVWRVGTVVPGQAVTVRFVVTRTGAAPANNIILNVAQFSSAQTPLTATNSTAHPLNVTAIDLERFEAVPAAAGGMLVKWEVRSMRNALGFYVRRSVDANTLNSARVNGTLIATTNATQYAWQDASGNDGHYYWLEEIEISGQTKLYGPVRAPLLAAPVERALVAIAQPASIVPDVEPVAAAALQTQVAGGAVVIEAQPVTVDAGGTMATNALPADPVSQPPAGGTEAQLPAVLTQGAARNAPIAQSRQVVDRQPEGQPDPSHVTSAKVVAPKPVTQSVVRATPLLRIVAAAGVALATLVFGGFGLALIGFRRRRAR